MSEIASSLSRRWALVAAANAASVRRPSAAQAAAPQPVAKLRSPVLENVPCESFELEAQRVAWSAESKRLMTVAKDAITVAKLYDALADDDLWTVRECVDSLREDGRVDVRMFEGDVRFAMLENECEVV